MKVLVTGAGGMVGSHMVEILHKQGCDVLGTYYKPTTDISEIDSAIKMIECDVRYYQGVQRIINQFQPDKIFHLAAQSYPTVSWTHPQITMDTNIVGTVNVFEAVKVFARVETITTLLLLLPAQVRSTEQRSISLTEMRYM